MARHKSQTHGKVSAANPFKIDEMLSYRISVVANAMSRGAAIEYKKRFGLTLGEWRVMALLGAQQPRSLNELARAANLDAGQTSRVVTALNKRGLVLRDEEEGAGGRVWMTLSLGGMALYRQLMAVAQQRHEIFLSVLTAEEHRTLDRVLIKLGVVARAVGRGEIKLPSSDGVRAAPRSRRTPSAKPASRR